MLRLNGEVWGNKTGRPEMTYPIGLARNRIGFPLRSTTPR